MLQYLNSYFLTVHHISNLIIINNNDNDNNNDDFNDNDNDNDK